MIRFHRGKMVTPRRREPPKPTADRAFYDSPQWQVLRRQAKERDGWRCRECGKVANSPSQRKWMEAHHVIRRADRGADSLSNLETLCHACHKALHQKDRKR